MVRIGIRYDWATRNAGHVMKSNERVADAWWTRRRNEYQAVRRIMYDDQPLIWMRLMGRLIGSQTSSYAELVRNRTLIETLYAERSSRQGGARWLDPRTRLLISSAARSLPDHERALAQYEVSMLDVHDRDRYRHRMQRWTLGARLTSVPIAFLLLWLDLKGIALVMLVSTILISYLVDTIMWCRTYLTLRQIWRAYSALGATPFL